MAEQFAIVTGASSGIGFSLAKELASRGYDLAVCSAGERLQNAAEELRSQGVQVTEVRADLATRDGVKQFWDQVVSMKRNIDVACINAGVGVGGVFWETDLDAELNMVYLNCAGTIQLAKYVVQHMLSRNAGRILFTASIAGEMVAPREAVYVHSKEKYEWTTVSKIRGIMNRIFKIGIIHKKVARNPVEGLKTSTRTLYKAIKITPAHTLSILRSTMQNVLSSHWCSLSRRRLFAVQKCWRLDGLTSFGKNGRFGS
jgi:short-subunit dehydrogenase involved in D-alanine esterification of teichoic acids